MAIRTEDFHILASTPERGDLREIFSLRLAAALHRYGTPAHRLETTMDMVMARLGLQGDFFALPTSLFAAFGRPESHRTSMMRGETGDVNLEKLSRLDNLAEEIILGRRTITAAMEELESITTASNRFGTASIIVGTALGSGIACRMFGGGWREIATATVIGLVIGALAPHFTRREPRRRIFDVAAAVIASALAVLAGVFFSPFSVFIASMGGLILLFPGMRLTTAMTEIASGHVVSGAARLTGAVMAFITIAFGSALGNRIMSTIVGAPENLDPLPVMPGITLWIFLFLFPLSMLIIMQAAPRDLPLLILSTLLAFGGARIGSLWLGPELGAFIGALALGLGANIVSRRFHKPSAMMIAPGLILLVPGSIGYKSVSFLIEQNIDAGVALAMSVAMIGIAIVSGLLFANALIPAQRTL